MKLVDSAKRFLKRTAAAGAVALAIGAGAALVPQARAAGGYYYVQTGGAGTPIVNSIGSTATNQAVASTNLTWPSSILLNTSVTNVTPIAIPANHTAIQFNASVSGANGLTTTNIVFHLGRSVQLPSQMPAGGVTNAAGTGLNIEWFMTATNTVPISAAAGYVSVSHVILGTPSGFTTGAADGAVSTLYVGWIDAPPGETVTNYQVWVGNN